MGTRVMRILALPDPHIPYNIDLRAIWRFAQDFKPDVVVLNGDVHDFTVVSHWIADQSTRLDGLSLRKAFDEIRNVILIPIKELTNAKIKYLRGNHEDWLDMAIELNRNGKGYWELENNLDAKKFNIEFFPVNYAYRPCENLIYIHGLYTNEYHAKKTVQIYHTSVIYGHTHDHQVAMAISPIDAKHYYKATSMGCLTPNNPHYLKNRPNRWVLGFNFAYVNEDTSYFNDTQVLIVNGRFWANGRYYK